MARASKSVPTYTLYPKGSKQYREWKEIYERSRGGGAAQKRTTTATAAGANRWADWLPWLEALERTQATARVEKGEALGEVRGATERAVGGFQPILEQLAGYREDISTAYGPAKRALARMEKLPSGIDPEAAYAKARTPIESQFQALMRGEQEAGGGAVSGYRAGRMFSIKESKAGALGNIMRDIMIKKQLREREGELELIGASMNIGSAELRAVLAGTQTGAGVAGQMAGVRTGGARTVADILSQTITEVPRVPGMATYGPATTATYKPKVSLRGYQQAVRGGAVSRRRVGGSRGI